MKNKNDWLDWVVFIGIAVTLIFAASLKPAQANGLKEKDYQNFWCEDQIEYRLPDKTRVDCLTPDFAIEFDYARKWAEAIGQAIHYGMQTDRRPGIVLIIEKDSDMKYWKRMQDIIWYYHLPVQTWMVRAKDVL